MTSTCNLKQDIGRQHQINLAAARASSLHDTKTAIVEPVAPPCPKPVGGHTAILAVQLPAVHSPPMFTLLTILILLAPILIPQFLFLGAVIAIIVRILTTARDILLILARITSRSTYCHAWISLRARYEHEEGTNRSRCVARSMDRIGWLKGHRDRISHSHHFEVSLLPSAKIATASPDSR